jgi:hypothetical protein
MYIQEWSLNLTKYVLLIDAQNTDQEPKNFWGICHFVVILEKIVVVNGKTCKDFNP